MRHLKVFVTVMVLSLCVFAAESPFSGTWKLNPDKSKLPAPAPKNDVVTIDADTNGGKYSEEMIDDKGQTIKVTAEPKFDGKDYPVKGDPTTDSVSWHRVNPHTMTYISKKDGKVVSKATAVVSQDGKVTTVNFTDYSHDKPVKGVAVFDKQ